MSRGLLWADRGGPALGALTTISSANTEAEILAAYGEEGAQHALRGIRQRATRHYGYARVAIGTDIGMTRLGFTATALPIGRDRRGPLGRRPGGQQSWLPDRRHPSHATTSGKPVGSAGRERKQFHEREGSPDGHSCAEQDQDSTARKPLHSSGSARIVGTRFRRAALPAPNRLRVRDPRCGNPRLLAQTPRHQILGGTRGLIFPCTGRESCWTGAHSARRSGLADD